MDYTSKLTVLYTSGSQPGGPRTSASWSMSKAGKNGQEEIFTFLRASPGKKLNLH